MKRPKFIVSAIIAVLILIFLFQNTEVVTIRFYFWQVAMSRIILISLFILLGFVLGFVVAKLTGKSRSQVQVKIKGDGPVS